MGFPTRFPREAEHLIMGPWRPTISDLRELQRAIFAARDAADDKTRAAFVLAPRERTSAPHGLSWWWALAPWLAALAALVALWANVSYGPSW